MFQSQIENRKVEISDLSSYFSIARTGNIVQVSLAGDLTEELLESGSPVILTIIATVDGSEISGSAALIISLPVPEEPGRTR